MNMDPIPTLPPGLSRLEELAYNLRWTWDAPTQRIFTETAGDGLNAERINPIEILRQVTQERCEELEADSSYIEALAMIGRTFDAELDASNTWYQQQAPVTGSPLVAYFSAEFGLTEQLPIYSGGLGVLAGDHLKSASALGIPLVGIGLFYYDGYFRQSIDSEGWQEDADVQSNPNRMPLRLVRDDAGQPITISVNFPGRTAAARIWQVAVGRIPLYLMDARLPDNRPEDRAISARLYGGEQDMRIRQEIMLGIGGLRVLEALGLEPPVSHLNEGHSSFLSLEQIRKRMAGGESFTEAFASTSAGTIFTTHTPVAAGHDYFSPDLMNRYFAGYARELGLEWQDFLSLGRVDASDHESAFGMTELAMRTSSARNGVSKLHGEVTREMWTNLWPGRPLEVVPVGHVTNGVHMATWIAPEMASLFDDHATAAWRQRPTSFDDWQALDTIPNDTLWQAHQIQKPRLIQTARQRLEDQLTRFDAPEEELDAARNALDPEALTIGFARRFTAYKRATLLMSDLERLAAIVADSERPVQFIFSGKAHPRDVPGKTLIQRIADIAKREPFRGRVLFLENYDMAIARRMVAGVDVWLNNPTRPQEASGTSGMKAAANGVLNFSILDGWWAEAWDSALARGEQIGWSIDTGYEYDSPAEQDAADAIRLYEVLEQEIIPTYYRRDDDGLPQEWIERMKASIRSAVTEFSGLRMVSEYTRDYYLPAAARVADRSSR